MEVWLALGGSRLGGVSETGEGGALGLHNVVLGHGCFLCAPPNGGRSVTVDRDDTLIKEVLA